MSNYEDIKFDVIDWKNENVLSSYALKQTPLSFIPSLSTIDNVKVIWEYGDGTASTSTIGSKYYTIPGKYLVTMTVFDCYSNALVSSDYKIIHIVDYVKHTFKVDFDESSYYDNIVWKNGKINGPIKITTYYPLSADVADIFYRVYDSSSEYYFNDTLYKFQHLKKTYSFFEKISNKKLDIEQFSEIDRISTNNTSLYAKISNNQIVNASSNDDGSFYVGVSGEKTVYFKDDSINDITIDLFFDKSQNSKCLNNLGISLSAKIIDNDEIDRLSITSNGMDGEYTTISSFNIDSRKFSKTDIPFVIKIKDEENYSVKNFPSLTVGDFNISILSSGEVVNSSYYTISGVDSFPGSFRGKIRFVNETPIYNIQLSANITTINDQFSSYTLYGATDKFDVFPKNFISIVKKNEDFDAQETFKDLRFQEFLLDKEVLFDDFMGSIFGNLSSSYDTLGKKIYEKISNFVENIQDVDRNEVFSLISQMKMMGTKNDVFNSNLFKYPEKIKRLMDLGSISKNKLLGFSNKFKENFDLRGYASKETYGKNLGNEINTETYIVSAGTPIVALEKFSNSYTLLNTYQPVDYTTSNYYPLSSYNLNWGWPLVLPDTFQFSDIEKYYLFFEYVDGYDGTLTDYSIEYNSTLYDFISTKNVLLTENDEVIYSENNQPLFIEFDFNYLDDLLNITFRDTLYDSLSLFHA